MQIPFVAHFADDESSLLAECKRIGPAGIDVRNVGRANFAITYSTNFCELVSDLLLLYKKAAIAQPVVRLSEQFQSRRIPSCRGADMTYERVLYLVDHHVTNLEPMQRFRVLDRLVKEQCPVCKKWKRGLALHIGTVHPGFKPGASR